MIKWVYKGGARRRRASWEAIKRRAYLKKKTKMREYLRELKESTPCADCRHKFPHYVMEVRPCAGQKHWSIDSWNVKLLFQKFVGENT